MQSKQERHKKCANLQQEAENKGKTGIFDKEKIVSEIVKSLAEKKGLSMEEVEGVDLKAFKESQYDLLADTLRKHLDMKAIYQIMGMQK